MMMNVAIIFMIIDHHHPLDDLCHCQSVIIIPDNREISQSNVFLSCHDHHHHQITKHNGDNHDHPPHHHDHHHDNPHHPHHDDKKITFLPLPPTDFSPLPLPL